MGSPFPGKLPWEGPELARGAVEAVKPRYRREPRRRQVQNQQQQRRRLPLPASPLRGIFQPLPLPISGRSNPNEETDHPRTNQTRVVPCMFTIYI